MLKLFPPKTAGLRHNGKCGKSSLYTACLHKNLQSRKPAAPSRQHKRPLVYTDYCLLTQGHPES